METRDPIPAVLILIFNRPDKVRSLIDALSLARPPRLYIAADGPRTARPSDAGQCAEARRIAQEVSWPCQIHTHFSETNLGVDPAVEAGINWFFEHETEGIILEDDCIPSIDFFRFAGAMLEQYREDDRVMMVSGNNFQDGIQRGTGSYYVSRYANTWGWATWQRAWRLYDPSLSSLPAFVESNAVRLIRASFDEQRHWLRYFRKLRAGMYSAWDAKWMFAIWNADGLCITPNVNLVRNIGFGPDATHTTQSGENGTEDLGRMDEVIRHPSTMEPDADADRKLYMRNYRVTLIELLRHHLSKFFV